MKCPFLKITKTKHKKDNWDNRPYDVVTEEFNDCCTLACMAYDEETRKCSMLLKDGEEHG